MEVSDDIAPAFATEDVVKTNQQIRGKLAFQLDKISKALHVKADSACNEEDVLDLIMDVLNKTLAAHPDLPSRSIDIILKDVGEVNSQQRNILEQIENSFFEVICNYFVHGLLDCNIKIALILCRTFNYVVECL